MPRRIEDFSGDSLIFCGGWRHEPTPYRGTLFKDTKSLWRNKKLFYTIDINPRQMPDMVADVLDLELLDKLHRRTFSFIYFECSNIIACDLLPALYVAYELLNDNGIVLYHGNSHPMFTSIPDLFKEAGFKFSKSRQFEINPALAEIDNGSLTLASKKNILTSASDLGHLHPEIQKRIGDYAFFDPDTPLTITKQIDMIMDRLELHLRKKLNDI